MALPAGLWSRPISLRQLRGRDARAAKRIVHRATRSPAAEVSFLTQQNVCSLLIPLPLLTSLTNKHNYEGAGRGGELHLHDSVVLCAAWVCQERPGRGSETRGLEQRNGATSCHGAEPRTLPRGPFLPAAQGWLRFRDGVLIPQQQGCRDIQLVCRRLACTLDILGANHRIREWFGLERTLKIIWFQPPCQEQGHLPPDQGCSELHPTWP